MTMRKPMTPTEIRLFKEQVIREYKATLPPPKKSTFNEFVEKLRKIAPVNIIIGIIASIILVWVSGWDKLLYLILSATIWITLVSTLLSVIVRTK